MKIYLAGPEVFLPDPFAKGASLKKLCTQYDAEGIFPMDNELGGEELANMEPFRGPSMDVGTAYEMGVGAALGKIVVGYSNNQISFVEKTHAACVLRRAKDGQLRDENGMAVEEFGDGEVKLVDNLMISCGVEKLCDTAQEAIKTAVELFKTRIPI
ncbi:hypothetical protein BJ878DRAFT_423257 [Calycina marina]|uniref:Nucleoside 2-deoxyribosyltransferase n=1 Tax=Calycina marina TaxID=1763456 RepID=A0A9P7Z108_9HELO|nr:hypothetical protein BJ878DRAFT_423257 [Calycina marina]